MKNLLGFYVVVVGFLYAPGIFSQACPNLATINQAADNLVSQNLKFKEEVKNLKLGSLLRHVLKRLVTSSQNFAAVTDKGYSCSYLQNYFSQVHHSYRNMSSIVERLDSKKLRDTFHHVSHAYMKLRLLLFPKN